MLEDDKENPPWDVKSIQIYLGGEDDCNGRIKVTLWVDGTLGIEFHKCGLAEVGGDEELDSFDVDDIPLSAVKKLKNFLAYAIENHEPGA